MSELELTEKIYTLDIPQREGKEGFIGTHFSLMLQIGKLISNTEFKQTDFRLQYMTHFLISMIPGKKDREALRTEMLKEITEAQKKFDSNEEKGRATQLICIKYIGSVMDFIDLHIGVSKENKIGFMVKK